MKVKTLLVVALLLSLLSAVRAQGAIVSYTNRARIRAGARCAVERPGPLV